MKRSLLDVTDGESVEVCDVFGKWRPAIAHGLVTAGGAKTGYYPAIEVSTGTWEHVNWPLESVRWPP